MTQARKKKVLEEVRRQRQRRTIISLVVVAILIGTIGYAVYALTQSKGDGNFPFPCLAEITWSLVGRYRVADRSITLTIYHLHSARSFLSTAEWGL